MALSHRLLLCIQTPCIVKLGLPAWVVPGLHAQWGTWLTVCVKEGLSAGVVEFCGVYVFTVISDVTLTALVVFV